MNKYDTEVRCKNFGLTYGEHRSKDDRCLNHGKILRKEYKSVCGVIPIYVPLKTTFEPKEKKAKS